MMAKDKKGDYALAHKVRELREKQGWTQDELAERADLSLTMIQKIEQADRYGRKDTHQKLATALGVSVGELLTNPDQSLTEVDKPTQITESVEVPPVLKKFTLWLSKKPLTENDVNRIETIVSAYLREDTKPHETKGEEKPMAKHPSLKALAQTYNDTGQLPATTDPQQQQANNTNQLPAGNAVPAPKPAKGKASTTNNSSNGNGKQTS